MHRFGKYTYLFRKMCCNVVKSRKRLVQIDWGPMLPSKPDYLHITSESKKPRQIAVVYHYYDLSRFFLTQTLCTETFCKFLREKVNF